MAQLDIKNEEQKTGKKEVSYNLLIQFGRIKK